MLLNSVIIILREVLEASILVGLFLAFSQRVGIRRIWIVMALVLGIALSAVYAATISDISALFDGVGQEVLNASIQVVIYIVLLIFTWLALSVKQPIERRKALLSVIVLGVVLASLREGCEIMLYMKGFMTSPSLIQPVLLGSMIGAGIGISVGVCIYYLLVSMPTRYGKPTGFILTLLVAGGMLSQAVQLLIQADWIISQYPLWDSSDIVSERSVAGQLLYALVGYEATPTPIQVTVYSVGLSLMIAVSVYHFLRRKERLCA